LRAHFRLQRACAKRKQALEKDLSLKQQFLDVVILRRGSGNLTGRLPDGLENLAAVRSGCTAIFVLEPYGLSS
jgi:hypothetical protein